MSATAAQFLTNLIPPLPFLVAGCLPLWVGRSWRECRDCRCTRGFWERAAWRVVPLILAAFRQVAGAFSGTEQPGLLGEV